MTKTLRDDRGRFTRRQPDAVVENHGSVFSFQFHSKAVRRWVAEHVQADDYQWLFDRLYVDHRLARPLADALVNEGFIVR